MTKSDLVLAVSKDSGISKVEAQKAVESFTANILEALKKSDKLTLIGFGTFSKVYKPARDGRNPSTGAVIKIAAKYVAKFKSSKSLEVSLNKE